MKYNFDIQETLRRTRRLFDGKFNGKLTYRKLFIACVISCLFFLWILTRFFFGASGDRVNIKDSLNSCIDETLSPQIFAELELGNLNIYGHEATTIGLRDIPYVGNGIFGLEIGENAHLNIKEGRALTLRVPFAPLLSVARNQENAKQAVVVDYVNGLVTRFQCFDDYQVKYLYYAHRNYPSVFVQEIQIKNHLKQLVDVNLSLPRIIGNWESSTMQTRKIQHGSKMVDYQIVTGFIPPNASADNKFRVITIVSRIVPKVLTLNKRGYTNMNLLTTINYSKPVSKDQIHQQKEIVEKSAIDAMRKVLDEHEAEAAGDALYNFRLQHTKVWNSLWQTGFTVSHSKAENALNGDRINATIYNVLSHARAYEFEESITPQRKNQIAHDLTYAEGCYDHYHTLQAENLWKGMTSIDDLNTVVQTWMVTLEKQGCHNLIRAGASGVIQSMVLSFGGFRFSNQHLEMNIHPQYLHRDFTFRRLNYGNMTHVNITVRVRDDNKAELEVVLDRSDRNYYACDAGCLDTPVQLGAVKKYFPVKLTDPLTSILYITADKQHIDDLRHAIHVKEVAEAPAHEHHVIFLHKHGSNLGGLPTLFWIAVCAIIVMFHVFLCKLIVKEYCEPPEIRRYRYSKP